MKIRVHGTAAWDPLALCILNKEKFHIVVFSLFLSLSLFLSAHTPGAIIFGSDQEVRQVMRAVRRSNATGAFSWIGSDGWSARNLVSDDYEPEASSSSSSVTTNRLYMYSSRNYELKCAEKCD